MDTDSLPPLLIFVGFLALFSYLSLAEQGGSNGSGLLRDNPPSQRLWFVLSPFKYACAIAVSITGFYLVQLNLGLAWGAVSLYALALLVLLTLIHRAAALMARRWPGLAAGCARPALTLLRRPGRRSAPAAAGAPGSDAGAEAETPTLNITEEELVSMDRHDREMLRSIIQLDNSTAHEVMIPRLDMITLNVNTPLRLATEPIFRSGHTRIPVYEENIDHIVGIIYSLDLLQLLSRDDWSRYSLRDLVRPAYFIPENKRLDDLLQEFQQRAIQIAIVVDEYGGTEGLITMEDLLEEIVGEIEDEFNKREDPEVVKQDDGSFLVSAGVTNDVIEDLFDVKLDNPDVDTIGGYVYMSLGRMPHVGDVVETEQLRIEIASVLGRRIHKLNIRAREETATGAAAG